MVRKVPSVQSDGASHPRWGIRRPTQTVSFGTSASCIDDLGRILARKSRIASGMVRDCAAFFEGSFKLDPPNEAPIRKAFASPAPRPNRRRVGSPGVLPSRACTNDGLERSPVARGGTPEEASELLVARQRSFGARPSLAGFGVDAAHSAAHRGRREVVAWWHVIPASTLERYAGTRFHIIAQRAPFSCCGRERAPSYRYETTSMRLQRFGVLGGIAASNRGERRRQLYERATSGGSRGGVERAGRPRSLVASWRRVKGSGRKDAVEA